MALALSVKLPSGATMPTLGLGVYMSLGQDCITAISAALKVRVVLRACSRAGWLSAR